MPVSDTQVLIALVFAIFPAFLAMRLGAELYK
ncbi:MAG: photosystem I reaction center subunit XII [Cyanobacteria bacterium P01_F01_bin.143]